MNLWVWDNSTMAWATLLHSAQYNSIYFKIQSNWDKAKRKSRLYFSPINLYLPCKGSKQQSAVSWNGEIQLSDPHERWPRHSASLSQSPSATPHGFELVQQLQFSTDQSHPEKDSEVRRNAHVRLEFCVCVQKYNSGHLDPVFNTEECHLSYKQTQKNSQTGVQNDPLTMTCTIST